MVQILGLKREIRIAFSQNGSIRLLKWNRNVIRNQCIRTCLDISTIPLHTFSLSRSIPLCLPLDKFLAHHLHHNHNGVCVVGGRRRCGLGLNVESCRPEPWLPASHARSTMEIKSVKRRKGERGGERKKKQENKIHSTSYASHFHFLCAFNV